MLTHGWQSRTSTWLWVIQRPDRVKKLSGANLCCTVLKEVQRLEFSGQAQAPSSLPFTNLACIYWLVGRSDGKKPQKC